MLMASVLLVIELLTLVLVAGLLAVVLRLFLSPRTKGRP
jgi:hypothetical protein